MNTGYCGKDCEKCRAENDHGCEGCKGGKAFGQGDCKIVDCVTSRGLDKCSDCGNKLSCSMIYNKDKLYGLERGGLASKLVVTSKGLGKWFTILFFICLGQLICSILDVEFVKKFLSVPDFVVLAISLVCTIVYAAICFVLNKFSDDFKTSAIILIIGMGLSIISKFLAQYTDFILISNIAYLIAVILVIANKFYKFRACAEATRSSDRGLSEQWELFKRYFAFVSIAPVIVQSVVFVIFSVILSIAEVVMFYMTMKHFNAIDKAAKVYQKTTSK